MKNDHKAHRISNRIKGIWHRFDNNFMKPLFIGDWPSVKEDHDQISKKIIEVFEEHQRKKIKKKELSDMTLHSQGGSERIQNLLIENPETSDKEKNLGRINSD